MRGPGFVCRVGGFGPSCLPPSRSETCCRGRVCGAGLVLSGGSIRWGCCERACGADPALSTRLDSVELLRAFLRRQLFPCGRLDSVELLRAFLRCRSFPRGRLEVERVVEGVDLDRASRTLVVGDRSASLAPWCVAHVDDGMLPGFSVRGEYNDSDAKNKIKNKIKGVKQGTGSFVRDSCYVLRFSCDNSPLKKNTKRCGCRSNPAKPISGRQQMTG